jgi:hypothetical protein
VCSDENFLSITDENFDADWIHAEVCGPRLPLVTPIQDGYIEVVTPLEREKFYEQFIGQKSSNPREIPKTTEVQNAKQSTIVRPVFKIPLRPVPSTSAQPAIHTTRVPLSPTEIQNLENQVSTHRWWKKPAHVDAVTFDKKTAAYAKQYSKWFKQRTPDNLRYLSYSYSALERLGAYF